MCVAKRGYYWVRKREGGKKIVVLCVMEIRDAVIEIIVQRVI